MGEDHSGRGGGFRRRFLSACSRLACRRRSTEPRVGLVRTRGLGLVNARITRSLSLARQSSLLRFWDRSSWEAMSNSPSPTSQEPARRSNRRFAPGSSGIESTATRSSTRVLLLLTFWPPGPEERVAVKVRSLSRTNTPGPRRTLPASSAPGCGLGSSFAGVCMTPVEYATKDQNRPKRA